MKNIKKLISASLIIAAMAVHSGICYAQSWDFEDLTDGSAITDGNGITVSADSSQRNSYVKAVSEDGNIVAQIGYDEGEEALSSAPYLQADFNEAYDYLSVGFKVKFAGVTSTVSTIPILNADFLDSDGNTVGKFNIDGRRWASINSSTGKSNSERMSTNTWHTLEFVFDLARSVYGFSMDGNVCATGIEFYDANAKSEVKAVRIYADSANKKASIISIDDITVGEYESIAITDAIADEAAIAENDVVSADANVFTFNFEAAVDEAFALSENISLKNADGETVDTVSTFSDDKTSVTVTIGEKLNKDEQYSFVLALTDFAATSFDFWTQPRENYIAEYKFTDSIGNEIFDLAEGDGTVKFVFTPSGTAEKATAIIMVHNGAELVDIACKEVANNAEAEIEIAVSDTAYTVTAFVIDGFANRIPLMQEVSIPAASAQTDTATEQKTELTLDETELTLTAKASVTAERKQELSWFMINPNVPDYDFADVNADNIKTVILDAGVATVSKDYNAFSFEKPLGQNPAIGRYQVWFADNEGKLTDEEEIKTVIYINEAAIEAAMTKLKSVPATELGTWLEYYTNSIVLLNINLDDTIYTTYTTEVHELIAAQISACEEPSDIDTLFETCLTLAELNNLTSGRVEFIRNNGEVFGIDFTGDYVNYSLTDEAVEKYLNLGDGATSVQDTAAKMRAAFAMAIINSFDTSSRSKYPTVLNNYNDVFGLNLASTGYQQNSTNVYQAFIGKTLNTPADVKSNFDTWVAGLGTGTNGGTQGGTITGGGGGGGGGASYNKPGSTAAIGTVINAQQSNTVAPTNKVFNDLGEAEWAEEYILALYRKGIVSGNGAGGFSPNNSIKREEAVKMIVSAFEFEAEKEMTEFADVPENAWYYSYIEKAVKGGIINGVSETAFGTGKNITRAEIAAILYRCIQKQNPDVTAPENSFADSDYIPEYAKAPVNLLAAEKIISGRADGSFDPYSNATRAEFSKMLALVIDYTTGGATNE